MTTATIDHTPGTRFNADGEPTALVLPEHVENDYRLEVPTTTHKVLSEPRGVQTPSHFVAPLWHSTAAQDAVDLAAVAGIELLPWQQLVLRNALGERKNGKWSSFEVALVVPRQNGKNVIIEARQLAGMFLFDEKVQVHTAHKFKTARNAHRILKNRLLNCPELWEHVKSATASNDNTAIELHNGNRIEFVARQNGQGRGFTGDTVYFDEAYQLNQELVSDLLPTLSAVPNPQVWFTSSAGMETSDVLEKLRDRALNHSEREKFFTYMEWSADLQRHDRRSPEAAAMANPSLGYFQDWEWIDGTELKSMGVEQYNRERLGVWADKAGDAVIGGELWKRSEVTSDELAGIAVVNRSLAVEVTEDRDMAVLAGAAELDDGRVVVEIIEQRAGTSWLPDRCKAVYGRTGAHAGIVIDSYSGAAAVAPHIIAAGTPVSMATTRDLTTGTADFYDRLTYTDPDTGVADPHILHPAGGSGYLDDAAYTARRRLVGTSKTAWTWAHGTTEVPLAPLRAVTLAVKGLSMEPVKRKKRRVF